MQAEIDKKIRYHARRMAMREQQRIALVDQDAEHLEDFLYRNIDRYLRGEPPLPLPDYWLDANLERWSEDRLKTSPAGRLTSVQAAAAEFTWKLRHFDALHADERGRIAVRALWEARQSLLEGERVSRGG